MYEIRSTGNKTEPEDLCALCKNVQIFEGWTVELWLKLLYSDNPQVTSDPAVQELRQTVGDDDKVNAALYSALSSAGRSSCSCARAVLGRIPSYMKGGY